MIRRKIARVGKGVARAVARAKARVEDPNRPKREAKVVTGRATPGIPAIITKQQRLEPHQRTTSTRGRSNNLTKCWMKRNDRSRQIMRYYRERRLVAGDCIDGERFVPRRSFGS